jgi:hypothetical protein
MVFNMSYLKKLESDYNDGVISLNEITELRNKYRNASKEEKNEMDRTYENIITIDEHESSEKEFLAKKPLKEASQGWIIAGFVFSILGGYGGLALGANYAFGRYDDETNKKGLIMIGLSLIMRAVLSSV